MVYPAHIRSQNKFSITKRCKWEGEKSELARIRREHRRVFVHTWGWQLISLKKDAKFRGYQSKA